MTQRSGPCGKRVFKSVHSARQAHAKAHFRLKAYWCDDCRGFHVCNAEKANQR